MRSRFALFISVFAALSVAPAIQANEGASAKYQACVACHGDDAGGNATLGAPALAGQETVYLQRQLQHFKTGVRGADPRDAQGAQMKATVAAVTDDDIQLLAQYLTGLPILAPAVTATGDLKNGNNYYQAKCGACHGGQAQGNPAMNSPSLALLDAAYLKTQFEKFRLGIRGTHPQDTYGRQMKMMSTTLPSDKDLDDVIAYIQSMAVTP